MAETHKSKIVLLGDGAVGKTSLVNRYVNQSFSDSYIATIGANFKKKIIDYEASDIQLNMLIGDLIGQQGFQQTQKANMRGATGALIICDLTRPETKNSVKDYWIPLLKDVLGEAPPMIFLANKYDLVDPDDDVLISYRAELLALSEEYGTKFYFTSAKTGDNVEEAFHDIGLLSLDQTPVSFQKEEIYRPDSVTSPLEVLDLFKAQLYLELGGEEFVNPILQAQLPRVGIDVNIMPTKEQLHDLNDNIRAVELDFLGEEVANKYYYRRKALLSKLEV